MIAFATRKKLMDAVRYPAKSGRPALHPEAHGDIPRITDIAPDRRSASFLGYKKYRDDETIPDVTFLPNAHGLGTPMEAERIRAARREVIYDKAFRLGAAIIVILVAWGGYGHYARQQQAVSGDVAYRVRAERLHPGTMTCQLDGHEGCLVCMHKDVQGLPVVSTHC